MKVKVSDIECFLIFLPFLCPDFSYLNSTLDFILNMFKIIVSIILISKILFNNKLFYHINRIKYLLLYLCIYVISTIINGSVTINTCLVNSVTLIMMSLAMSVYSQIKPQRWITIIRVILQIMCIINTLSVLLVPKGFVKDVIVDDQNMYFWGYDNGFIMWDIPLLTLVSLEAYMYNNKKLSKNIVFIFIIMSIPILIRMTGMSILILCLYIVYYIYVITFEKNFKNISHKWIWIVLISNIAIIFFKIQTYFEWFIINILKKDVGLTGRYYIWDGIIDLIKEKPLLGYGAESGAIYVTENWFSVNHAHNFLLNILYVTGVIGLVVFLFYLSKVVKNIKGYPKKLSEILIVGLVLMFVTLITESQQQMIQVVLLMQLALYCKDILNKKVYEKSAL